jgi:hypothetical protein
MQARYRILIVVTCLLYLVGGGCSRLQPITKADLEAQIKRDLSLTEIDLRETEPGKCEGTGKRGPQLTFKIRASYRQIKEGGAVRNEFHWEADDSNGNKGSGSGELQLGKK